MLSPGQASVNGLLLGAGTPFGLMAGFNPWRRQVRSEGSEARSWSHGGWSGAEWQTKRIVPIPLLVEGVTAATWQDADFDLAAAFAPVGDTATEVELRWNLDGREFVLFGRPRMVDVEADTFASSATVARCAFVALDPHIYTAQLDADATGLPQFDGGLTVPLTVPYTVDATLTAGRLEVVNVGTAPVAPEFIIDGPVSGPRVTVQAPDGTVTTFTVEVDLAVGQWLGVDVRDGTVLLDGRPSASRRRVTVGRLPKLAPGTSVVRFGAARHNDDATLTVRWRSAWW